MNLHYIRNNPFASFAVLVFACLMVYFSYLVFNSTSVATKHLEKSNYTNIEMRGMRVISFSCRGFARNFDASYKDEKVSGIVCINPILTYVVKDF